MFQAYILRCADGTYYTGHTDDLEQRVAQHQHGEIAGYTQNRRPVELAWSESFATREEAFAAERQLKGWSRAKKQALIAGDRALIQQLAKSRKALRVAASTSSVPPQDERNQKTPAHPEEGLSSSHSERVEGPSRRTGDRDDTGNNPLQSSIAPVIVLVRPQLGENIGKAARAMLNFGLTELRLVAPRDGWPNPAAGPAAAGADIVLDRATLHENLAEAVADCPHVYATTVRKRGVTKPVVTPEAAAREIHAAAGRSAIVFGPERSGLETSEVALARAILTVPINPAFGSLNLAQAVILCAYEWSRSAGLRMPTEEPPLAPAPQAELEGLIGHFEALLEARNYFWPESRAAASRLTLRNMLTKPGWNSLEVRTFRGILSTLERKRERNG